MVVGDDQSLDREGPSVRQGVWRLRTWFRRKDLLPADCGIPTPLRLPETLGRQDEAEGDERQSCEALSSLADRVKSEAPDLEPSCKAMNAWAAISTRKGSPGTRTRPR
jgi:hypothetical protein